MAENNFSSEIKKFLKIEKQKLILLALLFLVVPFPIFITSPYAEMPFFGAFSLYLIATSLLNGIPAGMNTIFFVGYIFFAIIISWLLSFSIIYFKEEFHKSNFKKIGLILAILFVTYMIIVNLQYVLKLSIQY